MVQYYTLEEASRILGAGPEELKQLAKKGELRPFQDRGTLRFRTQEIDELATALTQELIEIGEDARLERLNRR